MADVNTGTSGTLRVTASVTASSTSEIWWDVTWALLLIERVSAPNTWLGIPKAATVSIQGVGTVWSGTYTFDWRPAGLQTTTIASGTTRVYGPPDGSGAGLGDVTGWIAASATQGAGGPTMVTQALSLPTLITVPDAPSSLTATRTSDTSIALTWTTNPATGKPYTGQTVRVSVDGAAPATVANVSSVTENYTYTASANHKYVFTVVASNSAGSATSDPSNTVLTTPAPLASLTGAMVTAGTIRLTLPVRPTPFTEAQVVITETHDGGETWNAKTTIPMSSLSASVPTTWDDTSAQTGGTIQYRAVVQTTGGTQGTLSSTITYSNTLVLNTPPLAPTNLSPSGPVDASSPIRLSWTHNMSSDGAAQTSRRIEYSDDDGSTWTQIIAGNTSSNYYDWTPNLANFTAGQTIIFRVATAGSQPGTYGAWSANQSLTLYGALAVTLLTDLPPAIHGGGPLPVAWASSPTWGSATQVAYQVTMVDQTSGLTVFDTGVISGTVETVDIPSNVQGNERSYTVQVVLIDNHQVTSQPTARTVDTDFLTPGPVNITWAYDDETGVLVFYPSFSEETSSPFDDTVEWGLERSMDGQTWVEVGSFAGEAPISDDLPRLGSESWYRTIGFTALGVAGEWTIWHVPASDVDSKWGWLNFGDDFQSRVRFGWSQTVEIVAGRASETYDIEGGDYPVVVFGGSVTHKYAVAGKLLYGAGIGSALATASADEMVDAAKNAGLCLFRDARGAYFPARLMDMRVSPGRTKAGPIEAGVSFTVERVAP